MPGGDAGKYTRETAYISIDSRYNHRSPTIFDDI